MMNILDALNLAVNTEYTIDGEQDPGIKLLPGMINSEIIDFEKTLRGKLPLEIKNLLIYTRGFESSWAGEINFTGVKTGDVNEWYTNLFEKGITIASNKADDSWFLVIDAKGNWKSVYYINTELGVAIKQSENLADFIEQVRGWGVLQEESYFIYIIEKRVYDILKYGKWKIPYEKAIESKDSVLSNYASNFDKNYFFADLRNAPLGSGFNFLDDEYIDKYAEEPLWAIRKPSGCIIVLLKGLLKRLLSLIKNNHNGNTLWCG